MLLRTYHHILVTRQPSAVLLSYAPPRSNRLAREVETFIDRFRSVPAFTANLTMELFQKQTQC